MDKKQRKLQLFDETQIRFERSSLFNVYPLTLKIKSKSATIITGNTVSFQNLAMIFSSNRFFH